MADALGIDQGTLDRWKTRHKEFRIAIQLGKILADAEIAESLYNRARGMSLPAVKIFPLEATRGAPSQVVERSRAARISVRERSPAGKARPRRTAQRGTNVLHTRPEDMGTG